MKKKLLDASVWKFLLVGVGNTLLSLVLMFLLEGLGYWPSTAMWMMVPTWWQGMGSMPKRRINLSLPAATEMPSTLAVTPFPLIS